MKRWSLILVAGLLMPSAVLAQQVVRQKTVTLQLDIDAQGQVSAAKLMGPMVADASRRNLVRKNEAFSGGLAKAVTQVAMKWRFKAPEKDGHPVPGRTYATAIMKILKMAESGYRLDLEYQWNGPVITFMPAMRFPYRMRVLQREAAVVVQATVQPDGNFAGARIVKIFTPHADSGRIFARAALDAVRHWKGVPMQINGHAVATRMRTVIYFQLSGASDTQSDYGKQVNALLGIDTNGSRSPVAPMPNAVAAMDSPFVKQPSG